LDRSGGGVFRIIIGPAQGALIRAARSTQTLGVFLNLRISNFYLLAFLFAFTNAEAQTVRRNASKVPTVAFCELTSNPEKYVGKIVRTQANYTVWWESSYLYGDRCRDAEHAVHNHRDCSDNDAACEKRFFGQWKKLDPYMRSKTSPIQTVYRVNAVFIGRLVGPGEFGHLSGFKYEFRIRRVGKVRAIPRRVPWK
jgi:hypothetical protein